LTAEEYQFVLIKICPEQPDNEATTEEAQVY